MWVIPLFGQAVNKKKGLVFCGCMGLRREKRVDVLNPADSLTIPLCECTRSCVLSFLSALKYVFTLTLHLAFVWQGGGGGKRKWRF